MSVCIPHRSPSDSLTSSLTRTSSVPTRFDNEPPHVIHLHNLHREGRFLGWVVLVLVVILVIVEKEKGQKGAAEETTGQSCN